MRDDSISAINGINSQSKNSTTTAATRSITLSSFGPGVWFAGDFMVAFVCAAIAYTLSPHTLEMQLQLQLRQNSVAGVHVGHLAFSLGTGLVVALIAHIVGLHEPNQGRTTVRLFGRCALVSGLALLILSLELLLVHYLIVGRFIILFTFLGSTLGLFALRALIVGLVSRNPYVIGFVGSSKFTGLVQKFDNEVKSQGLKIYSLTMQDRGTVDLLNWVKEHGVDQIVVDTTDPISPSHSELLKLINGSLKVSSFSNFVEKLYQRIPSEHINTQWVMDCQVEHGALYKSAIKRGLDIVIASIALLLLLPVGLIAVLCIKIESPGPVIYRQTRVGQYGKLFTMLKLRSMVEQAEANGARWADKSDTRVTKVGLFLRRSRLDEIPQLVNVLAGEMSLVGPRPERPEFTTALETQIPFFVHRVLVKPGITGWAQVSAGYAASEEEAATKLSYDLYYIKNLSFGLDMRVLLRTISSFTNGAR